MSVPWPWWKQAYFGDDLDMIFHTHITIFNVHQESFFFFFLKTTSMHCVCVFAREGVWEVLDLELETDWRVRAWAYQNKVAPWVNIADSRKEKYYSHSAYEIIKSFYPFTQKIIITESYWIFSLDWVLISHSTSSWQAAAGILILV